MKKILMAGAALLSLGLVGGSSVNAATGTLNIDAVIVTPITVTCGTNLRFGRVDASAAGAPFTVTVDTTGSRTSSVPASLVSGGTVSAGSCALTGDSTLSFQASLPASATLNSGLNTMTVNTWSLDTIAGSPGTSPYTSAFTAGAETLAIGGQLNVSNTQAAGTYTGTATVTVVYN